MGQALLIEDEALIRMMLADMIEQLGHQVVAEAGDVAQGRSLAEATEFDFAILDVNVGGTSIVPVAEMVASRGLPFIFITGYGSSGVPDQFPGTPVLAKPFMLPKLKETIDGILSCAS